MLYLSASLLGIYSGLYCARKCLNVSESYRVSKNAHVYAVEVLTMAMARKCDRCGAFYEQYSTQVKELAGIAAINGFALIKRIEGSDEYIIEARPKDLCPDCTESLLSWLRDKRC